MNTHDIADSLEQIARLLRSAPSIPMGNAVVLDKRSLPKETAHHIAVNLATLSQLAQIDKQQWISFIAEYEIPVEIRPRDASRDIIGKLLRHLDDHPEDRKKIERVPSGRSQSESPELMKALSFLLKDSKE